MRIKKAIKIFIGTLFLLAVFVIIYLTIPQVINPNTEFQTELTYGEPVDKEVENILTPNDEPKRTRAIVILENEQIVYEYGPTNKIMNTASIRKSIIGLLYGIAVEKGFIDINKTLNELKIDEYGKESVTELESKINAS